jgi:hypothetical protein
LPSASCTRKATEFRQTADMCDGHFSSLTFLGCGLVGTPMCRSMVRMSSRSETGRSTIGSAPDLTFSQSARPAELAFDAASAALIPLEYVGI